MIRVNPVVMITMMVTMVMRVMMNIAKEPYAEKILNTHSCASPLKSIKYE